MTIPVDIPEGDKSNEHILKVAGQYKHPPKIANREEREQLVAIVSEDLMQKHHFATMKDNLELRYYSDGIYIDRSEGMIHSYIAHRLGYQLRNADRREVIEHIRHRNHTDRSEFDAEPDIFNLRNGLLNIRTGELRPHDAAYLSVAQVPRWYCPYCSCPRFSRFLLEVLENKEKVRECIKMLGYLLQSSMAYEKSFMFIGNGANGKGTLLNVIEAFFGPDNCASESLHDLVSEKFSRAQLFGKFVNLYADLEAKKLPATGIFKMLTSGDVISAQHKHMQIFRFRNRAKILYSANNPPVADDNTLAYYRRWVIFAFDKTFDQNPGLLRELTTEKELSGILNLALKGWRWLVEDGGFVDESVEKVRQTYEHRATNIKRFADEECRIDLMDLKYFTRTDRLFKAYLDWCEKNKLKPLDMQVFGATLREMGIVNKQKTVNKDRKPHYIGIVLKSDLQGGNGTLG